MSPTNRQAASKEASKNSTKEAVECSKPTIPILLDTYFFIDKSIKISWKDIKDAFIQKEFPENLEDREVYINIKRFKIHRVARIIVVLPCEKSIEWIFLHMDKKKKSVLSSESEKEIATYHPHDLHSYYKMITLKKYLNTQFCATGANLNTREILKSWWKEPANFFQNLSAIY